MSILSKIGITKEAIARLLGVHKTVETQPAVATRQAKTRIRKDKKTFKGRKNWHISKAIVDAVRAEPATKTLEEIAWKYKVSICWVWSVRKGKIRVK
jgi:hypothetical protein